MIASGLWRHICLFSLKCSFYSSSWLVKVRFSNLDRSIFNHFWYLASLSSRSFRNLQRLDRIRRIWMPCLFRIVVALAWSKSMVALIIFWLQIYFRKVWDHILPLFHHSISALPRDMSFNTAEEIFIRKQLCFVFNTILASGRWAITLSAYLAFEPGALVTSKIKWGLLVRKWSSFGQKSADMAISNVVDVFSSRLVCLKGNGG